MRPTRLAVTAAFLAAAIAPCTFAQAHRADVKGKDHPLFTRVQGFHRSFFDEKTFDRYEFPVGPNKKQAVEALQTDKQSMGDCARAQQSGSSGHTTE